MRRRCGPGFPFGGMPPIPPIPPIPPMDFGSRGWEGDWTADFGHAPGRRGGRRRMFDSGELRLVLLKLISDQPRHGYDLIRAIEELTHGSYAPSPGVIYPTLTLLNEMGLIEESGEGGSRKAYAATAEGRAHLQEKAEEVDGLMERLSGVGDHRRKAGGAPIKRAVRNLLSAIWQRVTSDDMEEERLHQIAAILDEAAQKVERLK